MIQQRIGDLLEILFAFHNDGQRREVSSLTSECSGFNICADLLVPKREDRVTRVHHYEGVSPFLRSKYAKATHEYRLGVKAKDWFIYDIHDLGRQHIARVSKLTREYREAMDSGCHSFDLVEKKVLARYTPEQNEHICLVFAAGPAGERSR